MTEGNSMADSDSRFGKQLLNSICGHGPLLSPRKGKIKEGMILFLWSSLSFVSEKHAFVQHVMKNRETSLSGQMRLQQRAGTWAEFWKTGRNFLRENEIQ